MSNPSPSSNKGLILPLISRTPSVGFITPEINLSNVLFPAPFKPNNPSLSPF